jgi:5-methylcytosine-specific restriction endonuclease McrA
MHRLRNQRRDPFARQLYGSAAWKRLREAVRAEQPACFYCGRPATTVDHVVGVRANPSLALDPSNTVSACRSCQEKRKHNPEWRGVPDDGKRTDADHPDLGFRG